MKTRILNTGEELGRRGSKGGISYRLITVYEPESKYNPSPTKTKNPKIIDHVNKMHDRWFNAKKVVA